MDPQSSMSDRSWNPGVTRGWLKSRIRYLTTESGSGGRASHVLGNTPQCHGCKAPPSSIATSSRTGRVPSITDVLRILVVAVCLLAHGSHAAFISTFDNCLNPNTINSDPKQLQFTPYWVWASFDTSAASHRLNVTIYGNVEGQATQGDLPPHDSPQWTNPNNTLGKIVNVTKLATTLEADFNVLDYTPYNAPATYFCESMVRGHCPIAPNFAPNA